MYEEGTKRNYIKVAYKCIFRTLSYHLEINYPLIALYRTLLITDTLPRTLLTTNAIMEFFRYILLYNILYIVHIYTFFYFQQVFFL